MNVSQLKVDNCPRCGGVFQKNMRNMCNPCAQEIDRQCDQSEQYLRRNWSATMDDLVKHTGIPEKTITQFIKEGKLYTKNLPNFTYACDACGSPIKTHHLCTDCLTRISADVRKVLEAERKDTVDKRPGYYSRSSGRR